MGVLKIVEVMYDDGIVCCIRGRRWSTSLCKRRVVDTLVLLHDIDARWYDRYKVVLLMMMAWHRCCNSETDRNESIINLICMPSLLIVMFVY